MKTLMLSLVTVAALVFVLMLGSAVKADFGTFSAKLDAATSTSR